MNIVSSRTLNGDSSISSRRTSRIQKPFARCFNHSDWSAWILDGGNTIGKPMSGLNGAAGMDWRVDRTSVLAKGGNVVDWGTFVVECRLSS